MVKLKGVTALTVMSTPGRAYRWWFGDPVTKNLFKGTFGKIGVTHLRYFQELVFHPGVGEL